MSMTRTRVTAASLLAVALTAGYLAQGTYAAGTPANKVAAAGSETEILGANNSLIVLSETVKINNPTDLIISASAECAIMTQVTNSADGKASQAYGQIKFHVNIDGKPVPVAATDTDQGNVVFCSRVQEQQWTDSNDPLKGNDDGGDRLRQYLSTRDSNAFSWLALNVGSTGTTNNTHKIDLVATWTTSTTGAAVAEAIVGNRTLVLEPVKAANGEVVEIGV